MKVIKTIDQLRKELKQYRPDTTIGFVPTMGYFHKGHLSLMDKAREEAGIVVVSIYVNPTQFGPNEDMEVYPQDFKRDEKLAIDHGVDIIFYPDNNEMYPEGYKTYVYTEDLSRKLCGKSRTNHFRGVTTIVAKLFNIVQPDLAVFGQKDHQQAIILQRMVEDLNFPVKMIVAPIIREKDGLALSSRNKYLSPEERRQATVLYKALRKAKKLVECGEKSAAEIKRQITEKIETSPLANIEYVEIVNNKDLNAAETISKGTFAAVAVFYGQTRLIDNIILK
ncbi:MAG: pantoate--beta-alanine ligase [Fidelibacterota bacterium]